jgi:N-acetylglucosamine kinase-like BadF-type ATPase
MSRVFLGVDIGSTTSHALLVDEAGQILAFTEAGPGNHEVVGYEGLQSVLKQLVSDTLLTAGIGLEKIQAAGFGISGYDWPSERGPTIKAIQALDLECPIKLVNDTLLGLLAGTKKGWGIAILAGSGENCWGRDPDGNVGRMTGLGPGMGEYGGGSTIAAKAIQAVSADWSQRGPATSLTTVLLDATGADDINDLIEGLSLDRYQIGPELVPRIFQAAEQGDTVAQQIVLWAADNLASLVRGVINQLDFQDIEFEIVEMGGVFNAGKILTEPFHNAVLEKAPGASFLPLKVPPVVGAILLAAEKAEMDRNQLRTQLISNWEYI